MFRISNEYRSIPYDGFRLYSRIRPRPEFVEAARKLAKVIERPKWIFEGEKGWQHFISLPVNGAPGALQVGWGPLMIGRNMPKMTIRVNPSTAGLDPTQVLALVQWVLMWPEGEPVAELATKLDFEGLQREIDAQLYLPGVRAENRQYEGESHYHGSKKGNQLKTYDKGLESGGEPHQVTRVEITEHFKNNSNPKQRLRRPTLEEFLRGDLVDRNGLRRVKVVDLDGIGDEDLIRLAREVGLTEAIRQGIPRRPDQYPDMSYPSMRTIRSLVNANASEGVLFDLYREQALAWHSQYDPEVAKQFHVTWSEDLGLDIISRAPATTTRVSNYTRAVNSL